MSRTNVVPESSANRKQSQLPTGGRSSQVTINPPIAPTPARQESIGANTDFINDTRIWGETG
jgi:hypothetical protein